MTWSKIDYEELCLKETRILMIVRDIALIVSQITIHSLTSVANYDYWQSGARLVVL